MKRFFHMLLALGVVLFMSCNNDDPEEENTEPVDYNPAYSDDYSSIAGIDDAGLWGPYNLHDPTIMKFNDKYTIFSTDVMYGGSARAGIMRRESSDLVKWNFKGWVFEGIPSEAMAHIIGQGETSSTIWAPFVHQAGDQIRLYYSVSVFGKNISAIGLATSTSPSGPWEDKGIVISTIQGDPVNAIDPAVIVDEETGRFWMAYGSYWSGIYIVELDPLSGKRLNVNDKGKRIAARTSYGASIEGPEILYNPDLDQYYLFVSYGWLEDSYNVRVGRSNNPDGPFTDYFGNDMAAAGENYPMITARYGFDHHAGWQGFGHCGLLRDGQDYYYVSQARLASNKYLMDLHVRRIIWTSDGWPVIAPERFVNVPQVAKTSADVPGSWEYICLEESESQNESVLIELNEDGSITGMENSNWTYTADMLNIIINNGALTAEARLTDEWDWENSVQTICFTGLSSEGKSIWGKKHIN
jgi:arabinan endo-1,5-alpha-L-arabinosidase